ncbi:MAG: tRNA (N6-isopentenyl adenosine(37)-C2)-methylthiotransferase MiaB [Endomicrobium sp.]|nr:tRNA (N6-isopentenyl adenosine(37)-C2)-methylthiotransferase MiaB [Endomicrobium sp.]
MNYFIETIGCQMNVCESDKLGLALSTYGALKVDVLQEADVVILNTCSVRAQAEQKAFSFLGRAEEFKQENPGVKIVVVGCMAERIGSKIKRRFKNVDLIVGAKDIDNAILKIADLCNIDYSLLRKIEDSSSNVVRYVTIMRGCDNYCSYCVVPFVRGGEISLNALDIIEECSLAVKNGAKEIMLLGQNVNSYKYKDVNFTSLVKKIAEIDGLERIRFMTNHPKDLSDELIDMMATASKVCSHIHLPMQSASNKILKAMNRKYTYEHYVGLVKKLRTATPDISITTDIIVGFPGETKEDFEETLKAVKEIRFGGLYAFRYSPRPDTKAANMLDDIPFEEKKSRHTLILEESNKISVEIVASMVGSVQQVLSEKIENGVIEARTRSGRKVFVKDRNEKDLGRRLNVSIKEAKVNSLFGDII